MFNLEPSEEQKMLQEMVHNFAAEQMRPIAHECSESCRAPSDVLDMAWSLGLVNAAVPEEYGGTGYERLAVSGVIAAEELAWGDLSMALATLSPALLAYPVIMAGTDEQKKAILPSVCGLSHPRLTAAVMESALFFDPGKMSCSAVRSNGGYTLNGRKIFVPMGYNADKVLVYAALEGRPGIENVRGFILDRSQDGLSIGDRGLSMGANALEMGQIVLNDAKVGADALLGGEQGCDFGKLMCYSRSALCALAVGVARAANEYARQYALERHAFGEPIAHRQAISFMLAEDFMEIEAARLLTWESAWRLDSGLDAHQESYVAKLFTDQVVVKATDDAVQTLGGHGYIREHPVERWMRDGRGFSCFEGLSMV